MIYTLQSGVFLNKVVQEFFASTLNVTINIISIIVCGDFN